MEQTNTQQEQPRLFDVMQPAENKEVHYFHLCTQIDNILNSYDDEFDAFSELVQNSMDSLLEKCSQDVDFAPRLDIHLDCKRNRLSVLDNGLGVAPEDFASAIKPNESLKRRLRHKNARGEKGAALVFLQFGHTDFRFESKTPQGVRSYSLQDGKNWFRKMFEVMNEDKPWENRQLPDEVYSFEDIISEDLDVFDSGCKVMVQFGEGCRLRSLPELLSDNQTSALNRGEHILRTRTAVGFVQLTGQPESTAKCLQNLQVNLKITFADESEESRKVDVGFHYPHVLAQKAGSASSFMTNPRRNSELLYDEITPEFLNRYFLNFMAKARNKEIVGKYEVNGYFSYAYQNGHYEHLSSHFLGLSMEDDSQEELRYQLTQINGGFQIAVKDYPNGRRHSFLHRSGAEDKSRTYVVLNFRGDYKPDYGRKNISAEVRTFVKDLCQELIAFATKPERKQNLRIAKVAAPHQNTTIRSAQDVRRDEEDAQRQKGVWLRSTRHFEKFERAPAWEDELAAEFCHHVMAGRLPGFILFGLPSALQLDALFDYELEKSDEVIYHETDRPLGVYFHDHATRLASRGHWLEFKLASDLLVEDFKKSPGESGKKYFTLVDLLVCDRVDSATDDYSIVAIEDAEAAKERLYYGVTHLLQCPTERSHTIQVICLESLRKRLVADASDSFPVINRPI